MSSQCRHFCEYPNDVISHVATRKATTPQPRTLPFLQEEWPEALLQVPQAAAVWLAPRRVTSQQQPVGQQGPPEGGGPRAQGGGLLLIQDVPLRSRPSGGVRAVISPAQQAGEGAPLQERRSHDGASGRDGHSELQQRRKSLDAAAGPQQGASAGQFARRSAGPVKPPPTKRQGSSRDGTEGGRKGAQEVEGAMATRKGEPSVGPPEIGLLLGARGTNSSVASEGNTNANRHRRGSGLAAWAMQASSRRASMRDVTCELAALQVRQGHGWEKHCVGTGWCLGCGHKTWRRQVRF